MEMVVADDLPPVVEVHHEVLVQKCTYSCNVAAHLVAQVQVGSAIKVGVDAGEDDAGEGSLDAAF
jgi:hypothetical protein